LVEEIFVFPKGLNYKINGIKHLWCGGVCGGNFSSRAQLARQLI
jgi:hypothetical protein